AASQSISCTYATLAAGATATVTVTYHVAPDTVAAVVANTGVAKSDEDNDNDHSDANLTIDTSANLSITKTGPVGSVVAGTDVSYSISVINFGPSDAQNVSVSDTLASGTTFVSLSQGTTTFSCTTPAVGAAGTVTCTRPTLASGASQSFTLVVHLSASAVKGSTLANTASIGSDTADAYPSNN